MVAVTETEFKEIAVLGAGKYCAVFVAAILLQRLAPDANMGKL